MRIPVPSPRSLAGQLFAMQAVLIAVLVAGYAVFTYVNDERQAEDAAGRQATAVARSVADSPSVHEAIGTARPSVELQPYAMKVMADTEVDFVTIMDPRGIRWTHPSPDQIGRPFLGHIDRALKGETITETYTGTLGASVRAVTPIENDDHVIIGLVSAGIKVEAISERVRAQLATMLGVAAGALALGGLGTYVINARLRRHTHGMNAAELSHMHDYHEAALHAVREGLLMLDGQYRVALINDGGRELLGVAGDVVGRSVAELGLPAQLTGALLASAPRVDEVHLAADRVLVVNTSPVSGGERRGTVVTLRDVTELQSVMGELDSERGFTQALRSQAHEAANRLHTVVSLIELGRAEEAVDFATAELELAQALTDQVVAAVGEPVLAALLLGKTAQANERGVELVVSEDSRLDDGLLPPSLPPRDLVTILGNLIDNAVDAAQGSVRARVTVTAYTAPADGSAGPAELVLKVSDTGTGVDPAHAEMVFQRGFSTKPSGPGGRGLGLALARQAVQRHGGVLTVTEADGGGAEFDVRMPLRTAVRTGGSDAASRERPPQEPAPRERASREPAPGEPTLREATAPEAEARETPTPETGSPDTASPKTGSPETASPKTVTRETPSPKTMAPETASPKTVTRETPSPETAAPDTASPETVTRETASPKTAARETASPKAEASETPSPKTVTRETASPKTAAPETVPPKAAAPETPTPETVTPKAAAPETVAPEAAGRKAPAREIVGPTTSRKRTDPETAASEATAWKSAGTKTADPHPAAPRTGPEETAPQEVPVRGAADRAIVTPAAAPREGTPSASPSVRASRGPGGVA